MASTPKYAWLWKRFDEFLGEKHLKQTKQRNIIIEIFLDQGGHVSAEDLHAKVRKKGHNIGLATVYRTLNLLKEGGFADQKQFSDGKSVFELREPGQHHDHLVCVSCGKVVEFENQEIEILQEQVAKRYHFRLTRHTLDLFGYCSDCDKKTT